MGHRAPKVRPGALETKMTQQSHPPGEGREPGEAQYQDQGTVMDRRQHMGTWEVPEPEEPGGIHLEED